VSQAAYIFLGPPGSGKGTLSKLCVETFGWLQLSTGNLCRKHIAEQTDIGKQIDFIIKSGKLIDDQLITDMVDCWLEEVVKTGSTLILDGFPRTVDQAQRFIQMTNRKYPELRVQIIRLLISDDAAIDRVVSRFVCSNKACQAVFSAKSDSGLVAKRDLTCDYCGSPLCRRSDDTEIVMRNRLQVYRKHEQDMLNCLLDAQTPIKEFQAEVPIEDMFNSFINAVMR
jgi:adenylate kinase